MDPSVYRILKQIASNTSVPIPSPSEPWGSTAWVRFLQQIATATG